VSLTLDGERVVCQVSDSGVGFNPDTLTHTGLGLVSMRERAALVGGDVSIRSRAGSGTRVVARLPLEPKDPAWAAPVSQTA
jgi:signal transduction histidine kinase